MRFTLNRTFSKEGFEFCGGQNHDDRDQHRDPFSLNRLKGSVQTGSFWQPGVLDLLL